MRKEKLDELKAAIVEGNKELGWDGNQGTPHIFYDYKVVYEKKAEVLKCIKCHAEIVGVKNGEMPICFGCLDEVDDVEYVELEAAWKKAQGKRSEELMVNLKKKHEKRRRKAKTDELLLEAGK